MAGIVPLSADKNRVMLIRSSRNKHWVLPKGGWETDEATAEDAAKREAWEEAGIELEGCKSLGQIPECESIGVKSKDGPKSLFEFFEATVVKEHDTYPEMRERAWMSYSRAAKRLAKRPELLEALNRSGVDQMSENTPENDDEDDN